MKPAIAYWIAVVIGFVTIAWVYRSHRESFVVGTNGTTTAATGTGTGTVSGTGTGTGTVTSTTPSQDQLNQYVYTEDLAKFPLATNLKMYLTSFSDHLASGSGSPYTAADGRWYNFKDGNSAFTLTNANGVPTSIKTTNTIDGGVPLLNTVMTGPSSESFASATSATPYELPNFTVAWYLKNFAISSTETRDYTLFEMFAESPNYVRLFVQPSADGTTVEIKAKLGGTVYTLENSQGTPVAAAALSSGSGPLTMAFTYKKCSTANCTDGAVTFYIGTDTTLSATLTSQDTIKLANSNVKINSNSNIGAKLYAFAFWDNTFSASDVSSLDKYWSNEMKSIRLTELVMTAIAAEAAQQAAAAAKVIAENAAAQNELATCRRVAEERANVAGLSVANTRPWQVNMEGNANGNAGTCSGLTVNPYGSNTTSTTTAASGSGTATKTATTTTTTASKPWWYIPYLEAMSGVQASAPDFGTTPSSTATPAPKAPDTLAQGIYRNAVRQMDVNSGIAENVNSKTPVQDPGKQAAGTPDEGSSSDSFNDILSNFFQRLFGVN